MIAQSSILEFSENRSKDDRTFLMDVNGTTLNACGVKPYGKGKGKSYKLP